MRPIDDILRDVIEKLEPRELGAPWLGTRSPRRLWRMRYIKSTGEPIALGWKHDIDVDGFRLLEEALTRDIDIGTIRVVQHRGGFLVDIGDEEFDDQYDAEGATVRDAVILALAEALGVETGEEG